MEQLTHSAHAVGNANWHLQFTPKYRAPAFRDDALREACLAEFRAVAARLGVGLEACEFGPDHVHLFVTRAKNYSAAELAQRFKGASSRALRRDLGDRVRLYEWGDSFWSDGYFHESVGRVTSERARYYIERQQHRHWVGESYAPKPKGQRTLSDFAS